MSNPIREIEVEIRDLVNSPRQHEQLRKDGPSFSKMRASLDAIGDTTLAMEAFVALAPQNGGSDENHLVNTGRNYLLLYGVLQALFVQQDAIGHLVESLNLLPETPMTAEEESLNARLSNIREIRNDSVGHPTKRGNGKGRAFNHISRISMRGGSFTLLTFFADAPKKTVSVDVLELIETQKSVMCHKLTWILNELKKQEMEHRREFRNQKLSEFFPPTLGHSSEKIAESVEGDLPDEFGASLIQGIQADLQRFKEALAARGVWTAYEDSAGHEIELLEYPLDQLREFFTSRGQSRLNAKDAFVFLSFIRQHLRDLEKVAREIDEHYEGDV